MIFQGEMINDIEFNVTTAAEYTETAKINLKEAIGYQKKARKVMSFFSIFPLKTT